MDTNNETPGWTQVITPLAETFGTELRAVPISGVSSFLVHNPIGRRESYRHLHVPLATLSTQTPEPSPMALSLGGKVPLHRGWWHHNLGRSQLSACSPGLPFKLDECALCVLLPMLGLGTKWGPRTAQQGAAADRDSWGGPGAGPIRLWVATAKRCFFHRCFS